MNGSRSHIRWLCILFVLLVAALPSSHAAYQVFHFGSAAAPQGISISSNAVYSTSAGYGFEPGGQVDFDGNSCTGAKPFAFSVKVPEGNYLVSVKLGHASKESLTTVRSELRRLSIERAQVDSGQQVTRTFAVNVRQPTFPGGSVTLKDREKTAEIVDWDDKLTLEFSDSFPALQSIEIKPAPEIPTLFLLGDSTVCDQPKEPYCSWGQMLPRFLNEKIAVANHAESGESVSSSLSAHRFDKVLSQLKSGDYVLVQFGHNDMKDKRPEAGAFGSYTANLKNFADQVRAKKATFVLVTPMHRRSFNSEGQITNTLLDFPDAVRKLATVENLPLIDLHVMSKSFYESMGPTKSKLAFAPGDGTHHNNYGAYELARCIVEGLKSNLTGFGTFLDPDAQSSFDPSHPHELADFKIPASGKATTTKPLGD